MANVKGLLSDPQFQSLSPQDQQATATAVDPDFGKLSPADFHATVQAIVSPVPEEKGIISKALDVVNTPARGLRGIGIGVKDLVTGSSPEDALQHASEATQPEFKPKGFTENAIDVASGIPTAMIAGAGAGAVAKGALEAGAELLPKAAPYIEKAIPAIAKTAGIDTSSVESVGASLGRRGAQELTRPLSIVPMGGVLREGAAKAGEAIGEKLAKFGWPVIKKVIAQYPEFSYLSSVAEKGTTALAATAYALQQQSPKFQKALDEAAQ